MIPIADNFNYQGSKPLDNRVQFATIADMTNYATASLYDGCLAYVTAEKKNYQYDSTNTTDPTLGKWKELQTGGGGGTTYTAGDGINISAEDVISTDNLQSGDMDDIVTPLPAVTTRKEFIKYSTDEQIVGEWIDNKPIYQKTISKTINSTSDSWTDFETMANVNVLEFVGYATDGSQNYPTPYSSGSAYLTFRHESGKIQYITSNSSWINNNTVNLTIRYTKTTD